MEREKRERDIYILFIVGVPCLHSISHTLSSAQYLKAFQMYKRNQIHFFSWSMYVTALICNFLKDAIALGVPRVSRDIHFGKRVRHDYMYH